MSGRDEAFDNDDIQLPLDGADLGERHDMADAPRDGRLILVLGKRVWQDDVSLTLARWGASSDGKFEGWFGYDRTEPALFVANEPLGWWPLDA